MADKKLRILLIFINLINLRLLSSNRRMHNFLIVKSIRIYGKKLTENRVNEHGNVPCYGVIPTFPDLEVIAFYLTAKAFGYDSENNLFQRLTESSDHIPNLLSKRQLDFRRKLMVRLAEEIRKNIAGCILNADVQLNLFETAHIKLEVPYRLNWKKREQPSWDYKCFRRRIKTVFSQLYDQFMMILTKSRHRVNYSYYY